MISCSEAMRNLWEYLDGLVDDGRREEIEKHLSRCRRCCGELEFAQELQAFLRAHASDDLPTDVRQRLLDYLDRL